MAFSAIVFSDVVNFNPRIIFVAFPLIIPARKSLIMGLSNTTQLIVSTKTIGLQDKLSVQNVSMQLYITYFKSFVIHLYYFDRKIKLNFLIKKIVHLNSEFKEVVIF